MYIYFPLSSLIAHSSEEVKDRRGGLLEVALRILSIVVGGGKLMKAREYSVKSLNMITTKLHTK